MIGVDSFYKEKQGYLYNYMIFICVYLFGHQQQDDITL